MPQVNKLFLNSGHGTLGWTQAGAGAGAQSLTLETRVSAY